MHLKATHLVSITAFVGVCLASQTRAAPVVFEILLPSSHESSYALNFKQSYDVKPDSTGQWVDPKLEVRAQDLVLIGDYISIRGLSWRLIARSWTYEEKPFLKISCKNADLRLEWPEVSLRLPSPWRMDLSKPESLLTPEILELLKSTLQKRFAADAIERELSFRGDCGASQTTDLVESFAKAWLSKMPEKEPAEFNGAFDALKDRMKTAVGSGVFEGQAKRALLSTYPVWTGAKTGYGYAWRPEAGRAPEDVLSEPTFNQYQASASKIVGPMVLLNGPGLSQIVNQALALWISRGDKNAKVSSDSFLINADGLPYYQLGQPMKVSDLQYFFDELENRHVDEPLTVRLVMEDCNHRPSAITALPWISPLGMDIGLYAIVGMNIELRSKDSGELVARRRMNDFVLSWKFVSSHNNKQKLVAAIEGGDFELVKDGLTTSCSGVRELPLEISLSLRWMVQKTNFLPQVNDKLLLDFNNFLAEHVKVHYFGSSNAGWRLKTGRYEAEAIGLEAVR